VATSSASHWSSQAPSVTPWSSVQVPALSLAISAVSAWSAASRVRKLDAEFAHCFRDLDRGAEAVAYAKRSLLSADGVSRRSDLFVSIVHAEGLLQQGELEEACAVAGKAIVDSDQLSSARCEAYVASLMRALAPFETEPAVQELVAIVQSWQAGRKR